MLNSRGWFLWPSEALARPQLSPFAPQKCVNAAHFRGAKGDNFLSQKANAAENRPQLRQSILRGPWGQFDVRTT